MKKIILFIAGIIMLSCSGDDNSTNNLLKSITGTWKTIEVKNNYGTYSFKGCTTEDDGLFSDYNFKNDNSFNSHPHCSLDDTTFDENGNFIYQSGLLTLDAGSNYVQKFKASDVGNNKIKLSLYWNSTVGDVKNNSYIIIQKQ
jgi:hypothetical protein